ncbi:hypothetical protein FMUND_11976 [Fusarium mundagurra]|uniref:Uncharacterized protein n=1 Tax=Fusarium mundagurra TaxID=1567541 RepID=A0A8H5Y6M8_9HYPO|nr:hypothetical protein FMUND_11976 [Fusarium mundagurra]
MPLPRILRLQDGKWNNPEDSIGTFIGYLRDGRYSCWEAAGPARLAFRELSPAIKHLLETSNISPTDIVSWSMYMVGHNERTAAPKLLICSTDAKTRKNIRQLIKDSGIMDKYPGIGLGEVSALPDRPVIRELSREAIEALLPFGCDIKRAVLADGSEPALGKRIFVVNPHDFSLRPATAGPIILHGDKCYQLTVAHAFRHTKEFDHSTDQQIAEDDCDFDGMSDDGGDEESQYDEITSKGSATLGEIESDEASFETSLDDFSGDKHSSSNSESPSSDHLDGGNDPRLSVESPEDNHGFGEFDISQLQYFGNLFFSSLIGSNPSLDYALIETSRMPENVEESPMATDSLVSSIGEIESDDISIVATTSPRCRVEGRLTATPSYIRLPEQGSFQEVYPIRLGKPLQDGDCGTAVFGKDNNRFYGHIVAGGPGTSIAYLVPAGEISRDIQAYFGLHLMQEGQQEHSKDDLRPSTNLLHGSRNSGLSSIRYLRCWELEELENDWLLGSDIKVQQWLQQQPNSQPSQNTWHSIEELLMKSRGALTSSYPSLTKPKRRTGYHYNGKNDEGRPADSLPSRDWSTILALLSRPQARRQHPGLIASLGKQLSWSRTIIDVSHALEKLPKRRNSHSTYDSKYPLRKRHTSRYESHALRHMSPAFVHLPQIAADLSLEASVDATQGVQRRTRDPPSSPSHSEPSSSSAQRDEVAGSLARRLVQLEAFEDICGTCIFWMLSPEHFSSSNWQTCRDRKDEISLIVTHIADHHGLIYGRDPQYPVRKYLASCWSSNPFVKAKGSCRKCRSLSEWNDTDFTGLAHYGVVLCLRCWRKFDKKGMKEHMARPLCGYNPEQPKAKKLWILYTAFCSETQLPSKPPKSMAPRKSIHRPSLQTIRKRPQQVGQNHAAAPAYNLETTRSPSGTRLLPPRLQPGSSLVPCTAGESTELLRMHSPNLRMDQCMLYEEAINSLWNDNISGWDLIGSHSDLQATVDAIDPPSLQSTGQHQELEPKGEILPLQMAAVEEDSGHRSADEKDI